MDTKKKITNDIEKLKKIPEEEKVYLDYSNCYIHCHRNIKVFHKCLNRLILYEGFIYCLNCKKVYNENQIKLYCIDCEEVYFSKIRKNYDKDGKVTYEEYLNMMKKITNFFSRWFLPKTTVNQNMMKKKK